MARVEMSVAEIMAILPATPGHIAELTAGLSEAQLHAIGMPGDWSINDVLAHLRACSDVLGGAMLRILDEDQPTWRRLSPRTYIKKTDYPDWPFAPALAAFTTQRHDLVRVIAHQPAEAWRRTAIVTTTPADVRPRSMRFYGEWLARHEDEHMPQIAALAKALAWFNRRCAPTRRGGAAGSGLRSDRARGGPRCRR